MDTHRQREAARRAKMDMQTQLVEEEARRTDAAAREAEIAARKAQTLASEARGQAERARRRMQQEAARGIYVAPAAEEWEDSDPQKAEGRTAEEQHARHRKRHS